MPSLVYSDQLPLNLSRQGVGAMPFPFLFVIARAPPPPLPPNRFMDANKDQPGQAVEIRIAPDNMTGNNPQVKARMLWGTDVYTEDSDLVAVLMHMGYYAYSNALPPANVVEVRALVRPMPSRDTYPGLFRNHLRSRTWRSSDSSLKPLGYQVERCTVVTRMGRYIDLEPHLEPQQSVAFATVIPVHDTRNIGTRSTAAQAGKQRMIQEVSVQYSLSNEPWFKYSVAAMADRGLKPSMWTSARLNSEVLFLETHKDRYELSRLDSSAGEGEEYTYRLSRCKRPLSMAGMRRVGVPLPDDQLESVEPALAWEDISWCPTEVVIKGKLRIPVVRFQFLERPHAATGDAKHAKPPAK